MALHQSHTLFTRAALASNAAFSLITGGTMLLASRSIADLILVPDLPLEFEPHLIFMFMGVGLLTFAGKTLWAAFSPVLKVKAARSVSNGDFVWVIGTIVLLWFWGHFFTEAGLSIVVGVAWIVGLFGALQLAGTFLMYEGRARVNVWHDGRRIVVSAVLRSTASAERVWDVIADHEGYADVSGLARVQIVSGEGLGMVRECADTKGQAWAETCTLWDAGTGYSFRVHTEADDYPLPFNAIGGHWSLERRYDGVDVKLELDLEPRGLFMRTMLAVTGGVGVKQTDKLLGAWIARMESADPIKAPANITARPAASR